ncbi:MAG: prepilin peptidase [Sphingomonadaceae bacterium]|nr:prepilin peptidase [Sphingomonadaceae bacterium]
MWVLPVFGALLGLIWGSFIAALCSRWPVGESVAEGRSRCDICRTTLGIRDLLPVLSYIALRGRCRHCNQRIGMRPVIIELVAASIAVISGLLLPPAMALGAMLFGWLLLPIVMLDYDHLWIPDRLVILLAVGGVIFAPMVWPDIETLDRLIGAGAGFLTLEAIRQIYKVLRKREGMGAGDPKLFAALGLWLGWHALPIILFLASLFGIVTAIYRHFASSGSQSALPLGSFLALAALALVWFG